MSFVSPRPRETLRSRWTKTHCFPRDQPLDVLLYLSTQTSKKLRRNRRLFYACWLINLLRFQRARSDHVQVESWFCCFPELVSIHPQHVKHFPPIGKRIWVEQYNNTDHSLIDSTFVGFLPALQNRNHDVSVGCILRNKVIDETFDGLRPRSNSHTH